MTTVTEIHIGIDPGVTGAISCFINRELFYLDDLPNREIIKRRPGSKVLDLVGGRAKPLVSHELDMDNVAALVNSYIRGRHSLVLMVCERARPRPRQGVVTTSKLMFAAGELAGMARTMGVQFLFADPNTWKTRTGTPKDKNGARQKAITLFPHMAEKFRKAADHNRAEAALIGWYGVTCIA